MRHLLTILFLLLAPPLAAQDEDIQAVIESQMRAFQAGDSAAAFEHASPLIKRIFGNSRNFGMMVRQGYPMVWAPAQVDFIDVQGFGGIVVQRVQVIASPASRRSSCPAWCTTPSEASGTRRSGCGCGRTCGTAKCWFPRTSDRR